MSYSFSAFKTFIASMASGIGLPPRMRTPSMSKAKANEFVVGIYTEVRGEADVSGELVVGGSAASSRFIAFTLFLAVSIEAAKPP